MDKGGAKAEGGTPAPRWESSYRKKPALTRVQRPMPAMFLCLVTSDFDLLRFFFWPQNNFLERMVTHFYTNFGDSSCISYEKSCGKTNRQTNKHIDTTENPTNATTAGIGM